jgi:hypothetical protein
MEEEEIISQSNQNAIENDEISEEESISGEETEIEGEEAASKPSAKISLIELLIFPLPLAIISDLADLISWSGIGTLISWVLDIVTGGGLGLWLFLKGLRGEYMILTGLVEMIPIIDFLPLKTGILVWMYLKQKNPTLGKISETIEKGASVKKAS